MAGPVLRGLAVASKAVAGENPDPLAQAIAARMAGQLNALSESGGLSALRGLNLPAAYAGDQRSLKAVQRAINEAETGLQSPGRRKLLKQAIATAARQAVPDVVDTALGAVGRAALKSSAPIPDESIQAAIWAAIQDQLLKASGPTARKAGKVNPADFEELMRTRYAHLEDPDAVAENAEDYFNPRGWLEARVYEADVDRLAGFPEGTTLQYLEKTYPGYAERASSGFRQDLIDDLAEEHQNLQFLAEETPKELWRSVESPEEALADYSVTREDLQQALQEAKDLYDTATPSPEQLAFVFSQRKGFEHYNNIFAPPKHIPSAAQEYFRFDVDDLVAKVLDGRTACGAWLQDLFLSQYGKIK
jgi:hypothetical protein